MTALQSQLESADRMRREYEAKVCGRVRLKLTSIKFPTESLSRTNQYIASVSEVFEESISVIKVLLMICFTKILQTIYLNSKQCFFYHQQVFQHLPNSKTNVVHEIIFSISDTSYCLFPYSCTIRT